MRSRVALVMVMVCLGAGAAWGQKLDSPAKAVRANFIDVDRKILEMAKDWPADKYGYQLKSGDALVWRGAGAHRVG